MRIDEMQKPDDKNQRNNLDMISAQFDQGVEIISGPKTLGEKAAEVFNEHEILKNEQEVKFKENVPDKKIEITLKNGKDIVVDKNECDYVESALVFQVLSSSFAFHRRGA